MDNAIYMAMWIIRIEAIGIIHFTVIITANGRYGNLIF